MLNRRQQAEPKPNGTGDHLLDDLPRGGAQTPIADVRRFPTARDLAGMDDLSFDLANAEGKLLLGQAEGELLGFSDDRHVVTVAGSRAGKSRSHIVPVCLTYPGSMIIIDPKGDLAHETALARSKMGQRVFVLDPFAVAGEVCDPFRCAWNPLQRVDASDADTLIEQAALIADGLIVPAQQGADPHWDDAAVQFVEAVIAHVLTAPQFEGRRTLNEVHRQIFIFAEGGKLEDEMMENEAAYGAVMTGAAAFFQKSDRERSGVLSTVRRHLHLLGFPRLQRVLENGPVDLAAMLKTPTTIYLSLPATRLRRCAGWLRMFINLALSAFEANADRREYQFQQGGHRVLMCLDEFAALGRMEVLASAAGQVAGLGCKLWPILQDLTQLKSLYADRWETFLGNAGVMSFFGNADMFTLEWLQKRLGNTLVFSPSHRNPSLDASLRQGETGESYSLHTHPLMTAAEIAATFDRDDGKRRQLVILPKIGPVVMERVLYDQHPDLRRLV